MKLRILPSAIQDLDRGREFPFAVYYKVEGDVCIVWRVLDCRQNPAKTTGALKRDP